MAITAQMVKSLREKTGAGMMDCKKALQETDGDEAQAVDWLRQKGLSKAAKRADRAASEGLIGLCLSDDGKSGTMVELKCETDFVAKSDKFMDFAQNLAATAAGEMAAGDGPVDLDAAIMGKPYPGGGGSFQDFLNELLAVLGENLQVGRALRYQAGEDGAVGAYVHSTGKLGVMVELKCGSAEAAGNEKTLALAKDLAMQVAAANPVCLTSDQVPQELIEREQAIYRQQALDDGKPENIVEKIVMGSVNKYYKEVCLLEQAYIRDNKQTIKGLLAAVSKEIGGSIEIAKFHRLTLGEESKA